MKYFKVLHDFTGADAVELTVKKGDLVCANERIEQDGWLKVEYASDTRRKGFVPLTYVREVANPTAASSLDTTTGGASGNNQYSSSAAVSFSTTPQPTSSAASAPTATSFTSAAVSLGEKMVQHSAVPPSPLQAAYAQSQPSSRQSAPPPQPPSFISRSGLQSSSFAPSSTFAPSNESPLSTLNTSTFLQNPNAVVEAFMKNEVYFKQLMKQRQDALARLEGGLADAVADVAACKDKNAILARKLRDLDMTIEKERKKWRERVDEEKLLIQRAASSTTAASTSYVMTTSTTTTSNQATASSTLLNSIAHQRSLSQVSGRSSAAR